MSTGMCWTKLYSFSLRSCSFDFSITDEDNIDFFEIYQQLATALLIHLGRVMGYTKAKGLNIATAKKLILVSLFYNANVGFALASLKGVNIPMYIAIKRLTPLAVLISGYFYGKGRPSTQVSH